MKDNLRMGKSAFWSGSSQEINGSIRRCFSQIDVAASSCMFLDTPNTHLLQTGSNYRGVFGVFFRGYQRFRACQENQFDFIAIRT
ncbi:hypothetical protein [Paenibacillus roseipurpureus]|uniref:Uncharacterized protein n=1 Tax=Paenibacillus roseopurpureus TaxID=2918901 RepID=A0AA96LKN3_9BACL|nr:hypothetical protein [Paenibacillus sp. MBLB1832]WNR42704.1 hypothetical protein MJB10_16440 [Paenibacillus sp. MBLB1832]